MCLFGMLNLILTNLTNISSIFIPYEMAIKCYLSKVNRINGCTLNSNKFLSMYPIFRNAIVLTNRQSEHPMLISKLKSTRK